MVVFVLLGVRLGEGGLGRGTAHALAHRASPSGVSSPMDETPAAANGGFQPGMHAAVVLYRPGPAPATMDP